MAATTCENFGLPSIDAFSTPEARNLNEEHLTTARERICPSQQELTTVWNRILESVNKEPRNQASHQGYPFTGCQGPFSRVVPIRHSSPSQGPNKAAPSYKNQPLPFHEHFHHQTTTSQTNNFQTNKTQQVLHYKPDSQYASRCPRNQLRWRAVQDGGMDE